MAKIEKIKFETDDGETVEFIVDYDIRHGDLIFNISAIFFNKKPQYKENSNDEPTVIHSNGEKRWHKNGKLHRDYGPAIVNRNGIKDANTWGYHGKECSEQKHKDLIQEEIDRINKRQEELTQIKLKP